MPIAARSQYSGEVESGNHDPEAWSVVESHGVMCGNDPGDSELPC